LKKLAQPSSLANHHSVILKILRNTPSRGVFLFIRFIGKIYNNFASTP
jgi:hypothetical protein